MVRPSMPRVPSPLPTNDLLTSIPLAVLLHSQMPQESTQHIAREQELGSDMTLTQDGRELITSFFPLFIYHVYMAPSSWEK